MTDRVFYGYVDYTDDGRPFYVGKGTSRRLRNPTRNGKHTNVSKKHGRHRIVEFASKDESAVFEWETAAIIRYETFGSHVGCNFTAGGEGVSGLEHSDETRNTLRKKRMDRDPQERHAWASKRLMSHEELSVIARDCRGHENRSEAAKRMWAARSSERRSEIAKKVSAAMTTEERSASAKSWQAAKTPEQRSATARKIVATHTPEERSEIARKREARKRTS